MDIIGSIRKWFRSSNKAAQKIPVVRSKNKCDIDEIPKYPPYQPGLPTVTPDQIVESQRELIDRIQKTVSMSDSDFANTYGSAIRSYASFVHLLPASESHHHRGTGGMFRHGLEAGLFAAMGADRLMFVMDEPPSRRRVLEPIWRFAAFLAALNHDIGKPLIDLEVTDTSGNHTWYVLEYSLYEWAVDNGVDHYHIRYRSGRKCDHEDVSILVLDQVITKDIRHVFAQAGPQLLKWLIEAIANPTKEGSVNPFSKLVIKADQDSVVRDLKINSATLSKIAPIGIASERFILDAMRRLIRSNTWKVNKKGARIWVIDGNLYVAWAAARDIVRIISEDKTPGITRDPDSIADMLIEREIAVARESFHGTRRYWTISPDVLDGVKLKAVRIISPEILIDPPPSSVAGRVFNEDESSNENKESGQGSGDKLKSVETKEKPNPPDEAPTKQQPAPKPEPEPEPEPEPKEKEEIKPINRQNAISPNKQSEVSGKLRKKFDAYPMFGEVVSTLQEEIASGKRPEGIVRMESGLVVMSWPDAFQGFGMEPSAILKEFNSAGVVIPEPSMPTRMVRESEGGEKIIVIDYNNGPELYAFIKSNTSTTSKESTNRQQSITTKTNNKAKTANKNKEEISNSEATDLIKQFIKFYKDPKDKPLSVLKIIDDEIILSYTLAIALFSNKRGIEQDDIKSHLDAESKRQDSRLRIDKDEKKRLSIYIPHIEQENMEGEN